MPYLNSHPNSPAPSTGKWAKWVDIPCLFPLHVLSWPAATDDALPRRDPRLPISSYQASALYELDLTGRDPRLPVIVIYLVPDDAGTGGHLREQRHRGGICRRCRGIRRGRGRGIGRGGCGYVSGGRDGCG